MANPNFTYNGHTYLLTDSSLTWQQAQDQAVSLGGNLVTINDAAEQAWLIATFTEGGWIGYTDQATEGTFQWISGETAIYTHWSAGEPNDANANEDYAQMLSSGFWNDNYGGIQLAGIIEINPPVVNNAPTLTAFSAPVSTGNEDSEITVSFADLQAKGNEADVDGTVDAFVVKAVSSGVLKIGLSAATATAWNALSNNTIDATHQAYWTPVSNANGTLDAFTVVAQDNGGLESATPVQASVDVIAVPDVNVTAGVTPVEGGTIGTFVITLDSPAPVGGLIVNYTLAGSATLATDYTMTAGSHVSTVTGSSFTIAAGETSAVLNVNALSDGVSDPNETVILNLTTGTGYQLAQSAVTTFAPKVDYTTSLVPLSVSTGDFNNDGKLDLVVANSGSNNISVLLRNATNTGFDTKVDYDTGSYPLSVSVGDFNNDGKLDLAVANQNSNTVSVLLRNTANNGFDTKTDYATGTTPESVSVGDFNNDGKLDLAVANVNSNTVSVLLRNTANTGFDAKVDYATGLLPWAVSVGDFNNDGKLDLAVANASFGTNTVSVLLRNATNTGFDAKVDYATGASPMSVGVGDFNNDGKLDLAVTNQGSNNVSVLLRNADNTGFDTKVDYATGSLPMSVSVGDFNNDGKLDLAVANNDSNTVSVLLRNADNTGFDSKVDYATGLGSWSVSAGDFNNDGKLDLAVANPNSNTTVSVLLNNSNPTATLTIAEPPPNTAPVLTAPEAINYTDTIFDDSFATVTGLLVASDADGDSLTYGIEGGTDNGLTVSKSNTYGELTVTKTTGAYSFVPNSAAIEPLIANVTDSFTVTVSDGQLSDSKTLPFTITQNGSTESNDNDKLIGTAGNDVFNGLAGDDTIKGLAGDDTIDGGAGADRMLGGKGNDTYYVDNVGDVVKERAWQGNDTVYSSISYTLSANVENLTLNLERASSPILTGTGNSLDNYLKADGRMDISAHAILDGRAGDDILDSNIRSTSTLLGGEGNDLYYVYNEGDVVIEFAGEGEDTVSSSIASYTLTANVENLILRHGAFGDVGISGTGNALANHLTSDIVGSQLAGLGGDDNYYVGNESVTIVESAHNGWDSVLSTTNRTLEANVEELYLLGTDNLNGTGNDDADNNLNGNAGDNILDGKGGRDLLRGKAGNDTLIGGEGEDTLIGGLGKDTYHLSETTAATDTVQIAKGDSLVNSYDIVNDFKLGVGSNPSRAGVDKLDLASTDIAHNVNRSNGTDSGIIESHHIDKGIISFDDIDRFTTPLTITATNLADVFGYLQANISGHDTVAFVSEGNTFVFQDGGAVDTLVELVGVTASSLSTTGSAAGSVWIV